MKAPCITDCKIDNYIPLLRGLTEHCVSVAICDNNGRPVWSIDPGRIQNLVRHLTTVSSQILSLEPDKNLRCEVIGTSLFFQAYVIDEQQQLVLGSVVALRVTGKLDDIVSKSIGNVLGTVAACISEEYSLNDELNNMAAELTARYEELNLLYNTDDQVSFFREGQSALRRLVKNCAEYLNVSAAFLTLPDKGVCFEYGIDKTELPPLVRVAHNHLMPQIKEQKAGLVINNAQDFGHGHVADFRCKVICAPVFSRRDLVDGLLVIVNRDSAPDFRNSDRNLLAVMSRKATKIVHTSYDSLTGLMRRNGMECCLDESLSDCHLRSAQHCLLHINVDQLHVINDTFGHQAGDTVLRDIAMVLREQLRTADVISRLDGDDFGVLIRDCSLPQGQVIAEKLRESIAKLRSKSDDDKELEVTASIGVAPVSAYTNNIRDILAAAEVAKSAAKEQGRDRVVTYERGDQKLLARQEQMHWVSRIQTAIKENQFLLYGQRILALAPNATGEHFEILLRFQESPGEIRAPGSFMPAAERYDLMPTIDRWVVTSALGMLEEQYEKIPTGAVFAINLSGQSLGDQELTEFVTEKLVELQFPATHICFEITETAAIANIENAKRFVQTMKALGCQFALDDFGSGLSSFGYLKELDVDYLKIDGRFVRKMVVDAVDRSMVEAIHNVGHTLGLKTVAEFVENDATLKCLRELGVDFAQGYGIETPRPFEQVLSEFEALMTVATK